MMTDREYAMLAAINAARVDRGIHALAADANAADAARVALMENETARIMAGQ